MLQRVPYASVQDLGERQSLQSLSKPASARGLYRVLRRALLPPRSVLNEGTYASRAVEDVVDVSLQPVVDLDVAGGGVRRRLRCVEDPLAALNRVAREPEQ